MSQQAAAGQGAPAGPGKDRGTRNMRYHPHPGMQAKISCRKYVRS